MNIQLANCLSASLISLLCISPSIMAEGDEGNPPFRSQIGSIPHTISPDAIRFVNSLTRLGPTFCPASDTQNGRTVCSNSLPYAFTSDGSDVAYALKVQAPTTHCAPVSYSVAAPGSTRVLFSSHLPAGRAEFVHLGKGFARGRVVVRIGAVAQTGQGCNTEGLRSWAVDVSTAIVPQ